MNDKNLKTPTAKEARERGEKGGIASGKARRDKKTMREALKILLELPMTDGKGGTVASPLTGEPMSVIEAIATATIKQAAKGDQRAVKTITDVLGENVLNLNTTITQRTPEEARRLLFGDDK